MNKKQVTCSALAAMMFAGTTGFTAFAAMPDATVLIKDKAYALDYAENTANRAEIIKQLGQLAEGEQAILKLNNKWLNNDKTAADTTKIPAVTYKDAEGKETKYAEKDGEALTGDFSVVEISAIGASKIQVNFSEAVQDAAKLKFTVKRDGVTTKVEKVSLSEDKKSAVLELGSAIKTADYEVTATYDEKEVGKASAKLEAAKLAQIAFLGEKAVLASPTDFTKAIVRVELQNQYGENWGKKSTNLQVFASPSDSAGVSYDANKGTITVTYTSQFRIGDKIVVNVYDTESGLSSNATLPVVQMANVDKLEIGEVFVADEKYKDAPITNTLLNKTDVYLPITIEDADGYRLTDEQLKNLLIASPIAADDAATTLSLVGADSKPSIYTIDGKQYVKIAGMSTGKTLYPGKYSVNVHATGGATATKVVEVVAEDVVNTFNFSQPDATMYPDKTATLPFTAVSQEGKELTKATELRIKKGQEGIYTNVIQLEETVANGMNATKIEVQGGQIKAGEDKDGNRTFTLKATAEGYITITVSTSTGKFQTTRVKVEKPEESTTIKGIDTDELYTLIENGANKQELDGNIIINNQYGDESGLTDGYSLEFVEETNASAIALEKGTNDDGDACTFVKPAAKGSETLTIKLMKGSKVVDTYTVRFEVLNTEDIDGYDVDLYQGNKIFTGDRNDVNHINGQEADVKDTLKFEVYGLKNSKSVKIANPATGNGVVSVVMDNGLNVTTDANIGTITTDGIVTKGEDKTAKLTVVYNNAQSGAHRIVKDVVYNDAAPKAEKVTARTGKYAVNGVVALKENAVIDLVGTTDTVNFLIKDQYGKTLSKDYASISIDNAAAGTIANGKLTVKAAEGETATITLVTKNGMVSTIKVLVVK